MFFGNSAGLYWLIYALKTDLNSVLYTLDLFTTSKKNRYINALFLIPSSLELTGSKKRKFAEFYYLQ